MAAGLQTPCSTCGCGSGIVTTSGHIVTLNLLPVVNNVLVRLEQQAPTLFGKKLNLPEVTSGQVPPGLQNRIES